MDCDRHKFIKRKGFYHLSSLFDEIHKVSPLEDIHKLRSLAGGGEISQMSIKLHTYVSRLMEGMSFLNKKEEQGSKSQNYPKNCPHGL